MHTMHKAKVTFSQSGQYSEPAPRSRNRRAPRGPEAPSSPFLPPPFPKVTIVQNLTITFFLNNEILSRMVNARGTLEGPSHSPCREDSRRR